MAAWKLIFLERFVANSKSICVANHMTPKVTLEIHRIRVSTGTTYQLGWQTYIFLGFFEDDHCVLASRVCSPWWDARCLNADLTSPGLSSLFLKTGHFPVLGLCAHQNGDQSGHIFLLLNVVESTLGEKYVFYP